MYEGNWSRVIILLATMILGSIVAVFFVTQTNIVNETADAIDPKETGREVYDSVDIVSYDRTGDRAIIHVGKDAIEDIRTKHAQQFGKNIQFIK